MLGINLERVVFASHKDAECFISSNIGDIALYVKDSSDRALVREFLKSIREMDRHDFDYVMEMLK